MRDYTLLDPRESGGDGLDEALMQMMRQAALNGARPHPAPPSLRVPRPGEFGPGRPPPDMRGSVMNRPSVYDFLSQGDFIPGVGLARRVLSSAPAQAAFDYLGRPAEAVAGLWQGLTPGQSPVSNALAGLGGKRFHYSDNPVADFGLKAAMDPLNLATGGAALATKLKMLPFLVGALKEGDVLRMTTKLRGAAPVGVVEKLRELQRAERAATGRAVGRRPAWDQPVEGPAMALIERSTYEPGMRDLDSYLNELEASSVGQPFAAPTRSMGGGRKIPWDENPYATGSAQYHDFSQPTQRGRLDPLTEKYRTPTPTQVENPAFGNATPDEVLAQVERELAQPKATPAPSAGRRIVDKVWTDLDAAGRQVADEPMLLKLLSMQSNPVSRTVKRIGTWLDETFNPTRALPGNRSIMSVPDEAASAASAMTGKQHPMFLPAPGQLPSGWMQAYNRLKGSGQGTRELVQGIGRAAPYMPLIGLGGAAAMGINDLISGVAKSFAKYEPAQGPLFPPTYTEIQNDAFEAETRRQQAAQAEAQRRQNEAAMLAQFEADIRRRERAGEFQ